MRTSALIFLFILLFTEVAQAGDWPMFRHDATHSGTSDEVVEPPLKLLWKYTTADYVTTSPVVSRGMVYLGSQDKNVYALDAATGALKWKYTTGNFVTSSPAVFEGVVYVASQDNNVYAFNAATGVLKWKYITGDPITTSPVVSGGMVYVGSRYGVYALDAATGALKWNEYGTSSPAISGGVVYIGSDANGNNVYALDAATGTLKWKYSTIEGPSYLAVSGDMVFVGSWDKNLYALDAATGALRWKYTAGGSVTSPTLSKGVIYISSGDNNMYALDAATGTLRWKYTTWGFGLSSPIVSGNVVYIGCNEGVCAFNATTGALRWRYKTEESIAGELAVSGGVLYVESGHSVYALTTGGDDGIAGGEIPVPRQESTNWGLIGGILVVITIGMVVLYPKIAYILMKVLFFAILAIYKVVLPLRGRENAPQHAPEQPSRVGPDILDAGYVLSKEASSLFNKKDYDGALKTYSKALDKFLMASNSARGDTSLTKSIENNILSTRKNILACKPALGISISEDARRAFEEERCEDAERLYNTAVEHFEEALKDAEELEDADEINKLQNLISKTKSNINSCYIATDKKKVEELSERAGNLLREAVKFRENMELSKARDMLKKAESVIEEAFDVATKREEFDEAQQILSRFLKNVREERNKVDELQLKPVPIVKMDEYDISNVSSSMPDIKSPVEQMLNKPEDAGIKSGISVQSKGVNIKTFLAYKGATIIYKVKIESNPYEPISDIKVYPHVPDVFLLKEKEKSIALIEPKSSQTVTFEIRPTGECGVCNVAGRVKYYSMASQKHQDIEVEAKSLSIVCPVLHRKEISIDVWRDSISVLIKEEENTKDIPVAGDNLFQMVSRTIKDEMSMYMLKTEVTKGQPFNGVARFYAEGVTGSKYAAQIEVIGGTKKSKLILQAWAEKEDALTGFYYRILDEIEKRINVKGYIDEPIIQNIYTKYHVTGNVDKIYDVGDMSFQDRKE